MKEISEDVNRNQSPRVIAFEGIDGSGKTVQIKLIKEILVTKGYKVLELSFPNYNSFFGKQIGELLSGNSSVNANTVDVKSMSLWYALDRWKEFQSVNVSNYDIILLNRFTLSSAVYQSIRNESYDWEEITQWVFDLEHKQLGLPVPDIYIVFDLTQQISKENVSRKGHREYVGEKADVYEDSAELIQKARLRYSQLAEIEDNIMLINTIGNEGLMKPIDEVKCQVLELLKNKGLL